MSKKDFSDLVEQMGFMNAVKYRTACLFRRPTVKLRIHDTSLWLRPFTTDYIVAETSLGDEFTPLQTYLQPDFDGVIVDAGGYIGSAAIKLATLFLKAKVISIEASGANFQVLMRNISAHKNIEAVNAALSTVAGETLELWDRGTGQWGLTIVESADDTLQAKVLETVQTISLSDILAKYSGQTFGLVKLDIEGSEKPIFEHCADDLNYFGLVFVELHDRLTAGCTEAFEAFSKDRTVISFGGEKFLSYA